LYWRPLLSLTQVFDRYTEQARKTIFFARYEASQFGNPEIQTEHLLLGILREDAALATRVLGSAERLDSMRRRIEESIVRGKEKLAVSVDLPFSQPCKRALAYGAEEAERLKQSHIGPEHLLVGLFREEKSLAAQIMAAQGLTLAKLRVEAARTASPPPDLPPRPQGYVRSAGAGPGPYFGERPDVGQQFRNLTALAGEGLLGPLIGRERELERITRILSRRTRRNPVLIGEPGVGKTAIVEGLAQRIAKDPVSPELAGRTVLAVDAAALIAPKSAPNLAAHAGAILFVHGLFDIAGTGYSWGVLEAIRILEPLLARSGLQCIATGTPAGYRETVAKAAVLAFHFEAVPVLPPNDGETVEILRGVKDQYEKHHDVIIADETIEAAVLASGRFLRHRFLPDRALDLLDEAAAQVSLRRAAGSSPEEREIRKRIRIEQHKLENAIANHEFGKAREHEEEQKKAQQQLRELEERKGAQDSGSIVTPRDIAEVAAALAGAPVAVVENTMRQAEPGQIEQIARELVALVPQGREWLEGLAAYLAGCTEEEAGRLAAAIRARSRGTGQS
jgi:ATP-dependent Clp protease ATP-binding subunit ClpC